MTLTHLLTSLPKAILTSRRAASTNSFNSPGMLPLPSRNALSCGRGRRPATPQSSRHGTWLSSVQSHSCVQLFATPWTAAHQAFLSITNSQSLCKVMSTDSVMPSNHLIPWFSSPSPPALNPSQHQGLFQWVSSSHQVAKVLELQLQHQSFQWIFKTNFL